jgi:hypothetical protein
VEDYANIGTSNIAAVYANPTVGSKLVRIAVGQNGGAGPKLWNFDAGGNITLPTDGNINFANGVNILSAVGAYQTFANANAATQATSINTINNTLTSANVGIGLGAGATSQGTSAVAIGEGAGSLDQGLYSVAIGNDAGAQYQGDRSVAVGTGAGRTNQGDYAVAIGRNAGYTNQGNNSIIINATTGTLNQTTANTFTVAPVRNDVANVTQVMFYNTTSKEVTYGNTISIAGNVNASQFNFANGVNIFDTITGVTSISSSVSTLTVSDDSGDFTYGALSYDYAVNGVTSGGFTISYSAPLVYGNVDINVGNVTATGTANVANLTTTGNVVQQSAYYETYGNISNTGGNLTCNFNLGSTFYAALTANVTANFTNVNAITGTVTGATIVVDQGATAYRVANVQVNGVNQTVRWVGASAGAGTASNTDVMSFSLIHLGGAAYRVLGQISNYG